MTRFITAIKTDITVQVRSNLYTIGISAAAVIAVVLGWLGTGDQLQGWIPTLMLLVVGGSTLLYVGAILLFEKDQGTLNASIVSPLRVSEYLWSKILTLSGLATLEAGVMIGGAMAIIYFKDEIVLPNLPLLVVGIILIGVLYTLIGIVLIVRYDRITDYLIPMAIVAMFLQLPFVYFLGWVVHPIFLIIPTSAPTVLMQAAYGPLATWEWVYAIGYTAILVTGLTLWAYRSFHTHIIMKVG